MLIRPALWQDAPALARLHRGSIRDLCREAYTPEEIAAWTEAVRPEAYRPALERLTFLVAQGREGLLGLCIADPAGAEVMALYVAPRAVGRGVGRTLLGAAEELMSGAGLGRVRLNSTLNAVGFYLAQGYRRGEEGSHRLPGGILLPCVGMEKELAPFAWEDGPAGGRKSPVRGEML